MIGKLTGRIDTIEEDALLLEVGGVGYQVFCSARTLAALPEKGQAASLMIETHVREDHIHLYGFPDAVEREWFRLLTTVQGVGVKMALAILGLLAPTEITQAVIAKDTKSLTRVSGVGPKLAERLVTELKNKVLKLPTSPFAAQHSGSPLRAPSGIAEEAISALAHLGYARTDAMQAVMQASEGNKENTSLEVLIRESLRLLAR